MTVQRLPFPPHAVLGLLIVAGALLRFAYLEDRTESPDFEAPLADAAFHDYWANGLATGNWTPPAGESDPRLTEVPFLRPPGYPYFLAAVYAVSGGDPIATRWIQFALGLLNCGLAYRLGGVLFRPAVGLVLAAFGAVYWALIYFEGELQASVLIQTVALLAVLALHRFAERPSLPRAALGGALLGLLALVRANALLFIPVAALWAAFARRREGEGRVAAGGAAVVLLAALLAVLPATLRNWRVSGDPFPVSANGAINLFIGNNERSDGISANVAELEMLTGRPSWSWFSYDRMVNALSRREGRTMSYWDVSRYFRRWAFEFIREHPDRFLALSLRRAALFWGPHEVSNNKAIRFEKEASRALSWCPGFPFVLAISAAGAVLLLRDLRRRPGARESKRKDLDRPAPIPEPVRRTLFLVAAFVATWFLSFVPFLAAARFRVPILLFVFLFGAYGVVRVVELILVRAWRWSAIWAVAAGAVLLAGSRPLLGEEIERAWWHTDRGVARLRTGDTDAAIREFEAALASNPGFVDARVRLGETYARIGRVEDAIREYQLILDHRPKKTPVRAQLAQLLTDQGRDTEALQHWHVVTVAMPDLPEGHFQYGRALVESGQYETAVESFQRSLELVPDDAVFRVNLGIALDLAGRYDEAIEAFREARDSDPYLPEAHFHLGNALQKAGDLAGAEAAFREAVRVGSEYIEAHVHLGNLCTEQGRFSEALAAYEKALDIDPDHVTALYNFAGALGNTGRLEEAIRPLERALAVDPNHLLTRQRLRILREMIQQREAEEGR